MGKPQYATPLEEASEATAQAFQQAVETIVNSEETDTRDKAFTLASLSLGSDQKRVSFFRDLLPATNFQDNPTPPAILRARIENDFSEGTELVVSNLVRGYKKDLVLDGNKLVEAVLATPRARLLSAAESLRPAALGIGKQSAGIAIGLIVAHHAIQKRQK